VVSKGRTGEGEATKFPLIAGSDSAQGGSGSSPAQSSFEMYEAHASVSPSLHGADGLPSVRAPLHIHAPGTMRVVCAWCGVDMGSQAVEAGGGADGKTSHGICRRCEVEFLASTDYLKAVARAD
jgi:hypothetical protein